MNVPARLARKLTYRSQWIYRGKDARAWAQNFQLRLAARKKKSTLLNEPTISPCPLNATGALPRMFVCRLRACDLVKLRVRDVCYGDRVAARAMMLQQKTQRPVQFEITPSTREALKSWIEFAGLKPDSDLFLSRMHGSPHLGTWQYA